ncbi:protein of unknown function [Candidatus Nitrosocosmicus franklandus]|uniref:Uncharacterized protein n=1 Tax=Candidatus Nitrosocosmicus franklandianus TaxID=1798806 RepID=A0A484I9G5_9ARCH|nr:protein of unknown function [Candidatus Nitrosocosmicus franklandus]
MIFNNNSKKYHNLDISNLICDLARLLGDLIDRKLTSVLIDTYFWYYYF